MRKIVTAFLTVLVIGAAAPSVAASDCGQFANLAGGRVRALLKRQNSAVRPKVEEHCREYSNSFFEAVKVRQAISTCDDGIGHRRDLAFLDSEINDLNHLIAARCRGS